MKRRNKKQESRHLQPPRDANTLATVPVSPLHAGGAGGGGAFFSKNDWIRSVRNFRTFSDSEILEPNLNMKLYPFHTYFTHSMKVYNAYNHFVPDKISKGGIMLILCFQMNHFVVRIFSLWMFGLYLKKIPGGWGDGPGVKGLMGKHVDMSPRST